MTHNDTKNHGDGRMRIGMIGLGRMGANLVRRLERAGHSCVGYDRDPAVADDLKGEGLETASSIESLVGALPRPRVVWIMVPAAAVDAVIGALTPLLDSDDIVIDGGNSYYVDDMRRAEELKATSIHYVDCGTSGGVWGLERGYSLMIGGDPEPVARLETLFAAIAPGADAAPPTPGRQTSSGTADRGYLHCGPSGAGHFVKMVHNGIEYGMMQAVAEGLSILANAGVGLDSARVDAETTPLRHPERYQYQLDIAEIAEVWRRGSVIASWLIDLTADALARDPHLSRFKGAVADSGEGRWTAMAAIEEGVPAPVITAALQVRFASRGHDELGNRLLSAMRHEFGGHPEASPGS